MSRRYLWAVLGLVTSTHGCGHGYGGRSHTSGAPEARADTEESAEVATALPAEATPTETSSPQDVAQAAAALRRGLVAYHRGDYAQAEQALKEAMTLHPFLAPAHLTLGKIYLLRGIAADDHRRLQKGRRMVEMAIRLDPKNSEAQAFLALFP